MDRVDGGTVEAEAQDVTVATGAPEALIEVKT
jgi:hypothetical protein